MKIKSIKSETFFVGKIWSHPITKLVSISTLSRTHINYRIFLPILTFSRFSDAEAAFYWNFIDASAYKFGLLKMFQLVFCSPNSEGRRSQTVAGEDVESLLALCMFVEFFRITLSRIIGIYGQRWSIPINSSL